MSSETTLSQESIKNLSAQLLEGINGLLLEEQPRSPLAELLQFHLAGALAERERKEKEQRRFDSNRRIDALQAKKPEESPQSPAFVRYKLFRQTIDRLTCSPDTCRGDLFLPGELSETYDYSHIPLTCQRCGKRHSFNFETMALTEVQK
jgi:hypothetical protein